MKKMRFLLTACLLVSMLTFTGCGNQKDINNDAIPDDQQNKTLQQDVDDVGNDVKDGVEDAVDDVEDIMDGDNKDGKTDANDKTDRADKVNKENINNNMGQ